MPRELSRDEYAYKAERDHLDDATPCRCGSCGDRWRYDQLAPIGDCSLTPGDPSPAARCADPGCDSLAYPERGGDEITRPQAVAMLARVSEALATVTQASDPVDLVTLLRRTLRADQPA